MSMPMHKDESESSSEESSHDSNEKDGENRKNRKGPNPRQMKILDKYNIMTCARNIMQAEKAVKRKRLERMKSGDYDADHQRRESVISLILATPSDSIVLSEKSIKKRQV